jgi:hypothetical protein
MRGLNVPIALALACASCAGSAEHARSSEGIRAEYAAQLEDAKREAVAEIVWPVCEKPPQKGKACGLLADEFMNRQTFLPFARDVCLEDPTKKPSDDCVAMWLERYMTAMRERYSRANAVDVRRLCETAPERCDSFWKRELEFLNSHDEAVWARYNARADQILREHGRAQDQAAAQRRAEMEAAERRRAVLRAIGSGLSSAGQSGGYTSGTTSISTDASCTSDYSCGVGNVCVKPQFSSTGTCARAVNQFGTPTYTLPRSDSVGPGQGNCSFDTDCPISFHCEKSGGQIRGNCMR